MARNKSHYADVLKFWRSIETFGLPDIPDPKRLGQGKELYELQFGEELPWEHENFAYAEPGKRWRHTLYFFIVAKEDVMKLLETFTPHSSDEYREPLAGLTCLSAIVLDQYGQPQERSYIRSSFAYGLKILRERGNPEDLYQLMKADYDDYKLRFGTQEKAGSVLDDDADIDVEEDEYENDQDEQAPSTSPLSWLEMDKEMKDLSNLIGRLLHPDPHVFCLSEQVSGQGEPESPFLNSHYLVDLNAMIEDARDLGAPLETYLSKDVHEKDRWNMLDQRALLICIDPRSQSPARWPTNPEHGLYSAQVAALNLAVPSLRNQPGLWGINGPPGTGKTTLLREIVADAVVSRARRLVDADLSNLFSRQSTEIADYARYHDINDRVFGNEGILVSSNNNSAVENISRELPSLSSIDRDNFEEYAKYFSTVAQNLNPKTPCWGLVSAVLGNATNRYAFNKAFWYDRNGMNDFLKENSDNPGKSAEHLDHFEETAKELKSLLKTYDTFHEVASDHHSLLSKLLKAGKTGGSLLRKLEQAETLLIEEYGISPTNLPDMNFLKMTVSDIHKMTPYSSPAVNYLRSIIFLKSLELHEHAILANPRQFRTNLNAFTDMLAGKHADKMKEEVRRVLWGTFFFCIPLVSATLASVEKLFTKMGKGSLGWLLLDEAGQANPASACGALWRAQRCILIGDTLQVPPVVTMPAGLGQLLQKQYELEESHWSPLRSSAQLLADRITSVGTYIDIESSPVWTGIPLRAHRRCQEPMFALANSIAYNNQMVKLTVDSEGGYRLPKSCWIDIRGGSMINRHTVTDEIAAVKELLAGLLLTGYGKEKEVYIISPFRTVGDHCREKFDRKDNKVRSGTIHTFQGKEADIVLLVLGTERKNAGARQWASSIPNMLNVAVTRAKRRLFVVGNRQDWGNCRYFDQMATVLPTREYKPGDWGKLF